jgi:hypothetical protein
MKPLGYVKKYKLAQGVNFSHKHFALDFGNDFISRLEVYKTFSTYSLSKFFDLIDEMENRWFQIEKKTAGNLPEKLWDYMYAAIMMPMIDSEFPHIYEMKQKVDTSNIEQLKAMLKEELGESDFFGRMYIDDMEWEWNHQYVDNGLGELGLRPNGYWSKINKLVDDKNSYVLFYIFDELTYQLKKVAAAKAKTQFRIHIKEKEKSKKMFDWWDYVFTASRGMRVDKNEYQSYFSLLGLTLESKEEDVKKSYRLLSFTKHPDKGGNKEDFVEITEAKNKCLEYLTLIK